MAPKHLNLPLVAGCSINHVLSMLVDGTWSKLKNLSTKFFFYVFDAVKRASNVMIDSCGCVRSRVERVHGQDFDISAPNDAA